MLRPTPRLLMLAGVGLIFAVGALASSVSLYTLVGWDVLLSIAFVVDALQSVRAGQVRAERSGNDRMQHERSESISLSLASDRSCDALVIDEAPVQLLPRNTPSAPRAIRLIEEGVARLEYPVRPRRRGRFTFGPINVLVDGPLGL